MRQCTIREQYRQWIRRGALELALDSALALAPALALALDSALALALALALSGEAAAHEFGALA